MKIRNGFVSNSSSTSFCIYGICVEDFAQLLEDCNYDLDKLIDKESYENFKEAWKDNPEAIVDKFIENNNSSLSTIYDYEGEYFYIGKYLTDMDDNQTFGNFKKQIDDEIKKLFKDKADKPEILEETISS